MVVITQRFFCCPLKQGIPFAGYYTSVLSTLAIASAVLQLFRGSGDMIWINIISLFYYLIYLFVSRNLIQGIRSEQRNKFIGWLVMSVITVLFSVIGIIYKIVLLSEENIMEDPAIGGILIAAMTLWVLIILVLVYCIWGVATLWGIYGEAQGDGLAVAIVTSESFQSEVSKKPVMM